MTDEQRKALTLYLGEPWTLSYNMRSFTTDADMMALFRKMVDNKEYDKFRFTTKERLTFALPVGVFDEQWLFYDPERFCYLVAEWLVKK
jgi:hypothetical protein